jgi:hypothetical protein
VARGNDGNLLQHGVEAELANALAPEGTLHLVCTHGMAPSESWENPGRNRRLLHWLGQAAGPPNPNEPAVVRAYRTRNVSPEAYPNTGEIVAALLGRDGLTGFISEKDLQKHDRLRQAWNATGITPLLGSWRQHLGVIQAVVPNRPWLFSMDPMTFFPDRAREEDDNRLYPVDLYGLLRPIWEDFFESGQPGAVALFCFELQRGPGIDRYELFRETTQAFARNLGAQIQNFEVSYGNPHVGAVLTKTPGLLDIVADRWQTLHDAD